MMICSWFAASIQTSQAFDSLYFLEDLSDFLFGISSLGWDGSLIMSEVVILTTLENRDV
jgi:hypothetical protein